MLINHIWGSVIEIYVEKWHTQSLKFKCPDMRNGTDLRRLPLYSGHMGPEANFWSQKYQRFCFSQVVGFNIFATCLPLENMIYQVEQYLFAFYRSQSAIIYIYQAFKDSETMHDVDIQAFCPKIKAKANQASFIKV